jgi:sec-independent protein translocase protein TatB
VNLDPEKLIVLFVIAMLILGPKRLPEAARTLGRWTAELRKYTSGFQKEFGDLLAEPREHTSAIREELRNALSEPRAALEAGAREAQAAANAASAHAANADFSGADVDAADATVPDPALLLPPETAGVQISAVPDDPNLN